jgi:hypothetical protein
MLKHLFWKLLANTYKIHSKFPDELKLKITNQKSEITNQKSQINVLKLMGSSFDELSLTTFNPTTSLICHPEALEG